MQTAGVMMSTVGVHRWGSWLELKLVRRSLCSLHMVILPTSHAVASEPRHSARQ